MDQNSFDDEKNKLCSAVKLEFEPYPILMVTVVRCQNVSAGYFGDMVDTPDPQVYLKCSEAEGTKDFNTMVKLNSPNAEFNETFCFVLPSSMKQGGSGTATLKVLLYDEDSYNPDDFIGAKNIAIHELPFGLVEQTLSFGSGGTLDIILERKMRSEPEFRLSHSLCDEELNIRRKRKLIVLKAMQKQLNEDSRPNNINEVPNVSIIGSGGGYRAMIGYSGAMEALMEEGIVDLSSNIFGLSGGAWYLTSLYTLEALENPETLRRFHSRIKTAMSKDMKVELFSLLSRNYRNNKELEKMPMSFVDFYGYSVCYTLLGEEKLHTKLSELRKYGNDGHVPFPLFTAIHVKNSVQAGIFHAHLEMTPYEISFPNYGINLKPEQYGSEWFKGSITRKCQEIPMHFFQGKTGSAFAIIFQQLLMGEIAENDRVFNERLDKFREELANRKRNLKANPTNPEEQESSDEDEEEAHPKNLKAQPNKNDKEDGIKEILEFAKSKEAQNARDGDESFLLKTLGNLPLFTDRDFILGRTAKVFNFVRGLGDVNRCLLNPLSPAENKIENKKVERMKKINTTKKVSHFVDSALLCNLPVLSALRPQRNVDVLICLDFSGYLSDDTIDYETLLVSERLARKEGLKFPKIDMEVLKKQNEKELHIFEDENDPECPIVLWFTFAATTFKKLKNYIRQGPIAGEKIEEVPDGERFTDFVVFGNPNYETFKVRYTALEYDRGRELMKFNVKSHSKEIKAAIERAARRRKNFINKK